jgi:hypothetical protein
MSAQSLHAQVSNAMTVAVNQENERPPISVSGQQRKNVSFKQPFS